MFLQLNQLIVGIREGGVVTSVSDATSTLKGTAGKPTWGNGHAIKVVAIIKLKGAASKPTWGDGRKSYTLAAAATAALLSLPLLSLLSRRRLRSLPLLVLLSRL